MSLYKNLLENVLNRVHSFSNRICHMRVGSVYNEFNGLQRIVDSVVHPLDSFETS